MIRNKAQVKILGID
jgi:hypothetical protein